MSVVHRGDARRDALVGLRVADLDGVQPAPVLDVVRVAEVAHAAALAGDALDEHVVVLRGLVVGAARARAAVDRLGEVLERARVGAGPKSFSGTSGKLERTSFQLSTFEPGSQIFLSSATERHVAHVFCWFTTTVSASLATVNARQPPIVLSLQACASQIRIGREASGEVDLAVAEPLEAAARARDAHRDPHPTRPRAGRARRRPACTDRRSTTVGRDRAESFFRLNVGFLTADAPTATDASTRQAATTRGDREPRRPCGASCVLQLLCRFLTRAIVAGRRRRWAGAVKGGGEVVNATAERARVVRGVGELAELAGREEGGLLADVDRVVADPLEAARGDDRAEPPLEVLGPELEERWTRPGGSSGR